jgi:small nuclear ribonucleoprotein (snRNP)-like protein
MLQELSDGNTLTGEIRNFEEKINVLESTVKKLERELKNEKNEKETYKKASELKLEELGEKIKVIYIYFLDFSL